MYADDTKLISCLDKEDKSASLQTDLNQAYAWSQRWLLAFNVSKCMVIHYGPVKNKAKYFINGLELGESPCERDLGVIFSSDLKWKNQITARESKANAMLGMLKKTFATFNCTLLRTVYVAFVRPLLEFAVPVWCPYLKGDIDALERVQHRATRLVKSLRKLPYTLRLERLQLTTLATRRERGDMIQIYKTFHRIEKIALIEEPKLRNSLRGHKHVI